MKYLDILKEITSQHYYEAADQHTLNAIAHEFFEACPGEYEIIIAFSRTHPGERVGQENNLLDVNINFTDDTAKTYWYLKWG